MNTNAKLVIPAGFTTYRVTRGNLLMKDIYDVCVEVIGVGVVATVTFLEKDQPKGVLVWQVDRDEHRWYEKSTIRDMAREYAREQCGWELPFELECN